MEEHSVQSHPLSDSKFPDNIIAFFFVLEDGFKVGRCKLWGFLSIILLKCFCRGRLYQCWIYLKANSFCVARPVSLPLHLLPSNLALISSLVSTISTAPYVYSVWMWFYLSSVLPSLYWWLKKICCRWLKMLLFLCFGLSCGLFPSTSSRIKFYRGYGYHPFLLHPPAIVVFCT